MQITTYLYVHVSYIIKASTRLFLSKKKYARSSKQFPPLKLKMYP